MASNSRPAWSRRLASGTCGAGERLRGPEGGAPQVIPGRDWPSPAAKGSASHRSLASRHGPLRWRECLSYLQPAPGCRRDRQGALCATVTHQSAIAPGNRRASQIAVDDWSSHCTFTTPARWTAFGQSPPLLYSWRYIVKVMARVSSKNQVTLPVGVMRAAGLEPGDEVTVRSVGAGEIVIAARVSRVRRHAGIATGIYEPGELERLRDEWSR